MEVIGHLHAPPNLLKVLPVPTQQKAGQAQDLVWILSVFALLGIKPQCLICPTCGTVTILPASNINSYQIFHPTLGNQT